MVESSECDSFLARNCKAIFLRRLSFHAVSKLILYTDWDLATPLQKEIIRESVDSLCRARGSLSSPNSVW